MRFRNICTAAAGAAIVAGGCAAARLDLPAITEAPTGRHVAGKVVWHDLLTHTPEASRRFYGELFGWDFEPSGVDGYTLIRHEGRLIGGMVDTLALNGRDDISQWIMALSVDDVDAAAARFVDAGGRVLTAPIDMPRRGRIAVVADAEGALLALLQARDGDPPDREPAVGGFLWDELWSADADGAESFYAGLAGYDVEHATVSGSSRDYRLLRTAGTPRLGIMARPLDDLDPVWVNYLRVENPADVTARVAGLGGRILVEARERPAGGSVAFVAGPSGAGIALQTWPLTNRGDAG